MPINHDARLEVLLGALCAFAEALSPQSRQAAGRALTRRAASLAIDPTADVAVAADLAHLLTALGCLPSLIPASGDTV
jgi:hypothetical protein